MKEATDLLARLLAVEKLTVIDGGCTTSSIDLDNRVTNVVRFEDDSPLTCKEVRITCIAHEVGHAILPRYHYFIIMSMKNIQTYSHTLI